MLELGVYMDARALDRLRWLIAPWRGELRVLGRKRFEDLAGEPGYSWAPFGGQIGIHYRDRVVLIDSPVRVHRVHEVIHEIAHVFACPVEPDRAEEYDFLGWEMVVAQRVGLPWSAWKERNNYQLWDGVSECRWAGEVQDCTDAQLEALLADRLARSRELGQVDADGRPLCVRTRLEDYRSSVPSKRSPKAGSLTMAYGPPKGVVL